MVSEELRGSAVIEPIREHGLMHGNQWTTPGFLPGSMHLNIQGTHTRTHTHTLGVSFVNPINQHVVRHW